MDVIPDAELAAIAAAWDRAMVSNDADAIGRFMADDWLIVGADGDTTDKASFLEQIRSGRLTHDTMTTTDIRVRRYGDAAVLLATGVSAGTFEGRRFHEQERQSNVFVRSNEDWRCVLTHLSRLVMALALLLAPGIARTQEIDLQRDAWIRLRATTLSGLRHGRVAATGRDTFQLALDMGGPPVPVAQRDIVWLEVSRGRPGAKKAGLVGAAIGAGVGLLASSILIQRCSGDQCTGLIPVHNPRERALAVAGVMGAGAILGFVAGNLFVRERWELLLDRGATRNAR